MNNAAGMVNRRMAEIRSVSAGETERAQTIGGQQHQNVCLSHRPLQHLGSMQQDKTRLNGGNQIMITFTFTYSVAARNITEMCTE